MDNCIESSTIVMMKKKWCNKCTNNAHNSSRRLLYRSEALNSTILGTVKNCKVLLAHL